jgi:hypothetical protein
MDAFVAFPFLQGIQSLIDSGVKEAEISYQLQFSKQNLKRLLSQYTVKEVKRVGAQVL